MEFIFNFGLCYTISCAYRHNDEDFFDFRGWFCGQNSQSSQGTTEELGISVKLYSTQWSQLWELHTELPVNHGNLLKVIDFSV